MVILFGVLFSGCGVDGLVSVFPSTVRPWQTRLELARWKTSSRKRREGENFIFDN
jgi:hypothetical protein